MADPIIIVEAPERAPRRGGIRSAAKFVGGQNRLAGGGNIAFMSPGCGEVYDDVVLCYPSDDEAEQGEKTRDGIETLDGVVAAFPLYAGVECYLGGEDYEAKAREKLELGEDRGIEKKVGDYLHGIDMAGEVEDIVLAIAEAEQTADQKYVGLPVIWMSRHDAIVAKGEGVLKGDDEGNLTTVTGTPVIASGSLIKNEIFITGATTVYHTDVEANRAPDVTHNREMAIAERVYAVAIDCEFVMGYTIAAPTTEGA